MRTVVAVISGFLIASLLILAGDWMYTLVAGPAMTGSSSATTLGMALLSLLFIAVSVALGGYIASRIRNSVETLAGYVVFQLFFGLEFTREFWSNGVAWYRIAAILLIIPSTMIGRVLAQKWTRSNPVEAT